MNIVIAGAGAIGFHLAELLSREQHDITLVDRNEEVLAQAGKVLDVMTIQGDAASLEVLEQLNLRKTSLFIAITTYEHTNLLAAVLAKRKGASTTIARISNAEHLHPDRKAHFHELGVDLLISPQKLAALEIQRLLRQASFTDLFEFEDGKLSVVGFTIDGSCPFLNLQIRQMYDHASAFQFKAIAILRGHDTLIPDPDTRLLDGDHLYLATEKKALNKVLHFFGKELKPVRHVMIVGNTPLALKAAQQIENHYAVTLVVENEDDAKAYDERLEHSLVIHAPADDIDTLKSEGLEVMDAFIALTDNSETNIITSLMAEELGVYKTVALVENINYIHISQNIGIDTIINKKLIAANNIFRFVRKGKVEAIASLHGVNAEIIEFVIHKNNGLLRHPIKKLGLPNGSIIAGVIRGNENILPGPDFTFDLMDKVIILALPGAIHRVEKIFK